MLRRFAPRNDGVGSLGMFFVCVNEIWGRRVVFVVFPGAVGFFGGDGYHGYAIIYRADMGAEVAADAFLVDDFVAAGAVFA